MALQRTGSGTGSANHVPRALPVPVPGNLSSGFGEGISTEITCAATVMHRTHLVVQ